MNPSKRKGDTFERQIVNDSLSLGLKAYRNRMSRSPQGDDSWDVSIAGKYMEVKKRGSGFKQIRKWLGHNDGVVIGSDREEPLVVIRLKDFLRLL